MAAAAADSTRKVRREFVMAVILGACGAMDKTAAIIFM